MFFYSISSKVGKVKVFVKNNKDIVEKKQLKLLSKRKSGKNNIFLSKGA